MDSSRTITARAWAAVGEIPTGKSANAPSARSRTDLSKPNPLRPQGGLMSVAQRIVSDAIAQALLAEFEQQVPITRRYIERVPEDKLTWKPHERSLTAGQLAFHLASVPGGIIRLVQQTPAELSARSGAPQPASRAEKKKKQKESIAAVRQI